MGNLTVNHNLQVWGTKNFLHPHPTDSTKVIKYIALESGEALTVTRGLAKTVNGTAEIFLTEDFVLVTSKKAPLTVIVTPEKAPVTLFIKDKSYKKICVGMKSTDHFEFGDVEFAHQITGVRDGFEDEEIIVDEENLGKEKDMSNNEVKKRIAKFSMKAKATAKLKMQGKDKKIK